MRDFIVEIMQNPKVGIALGGAVGSVGAAAKFLDIAKDWITGSGMVVGVVLSVVALIAQIVRIKNDQAADRRAESAERRAEELHQEQLKKIRNHDHS